MVDTSGTAAEFALNDFHYQVLHGPDVDEEQLKACAILFSKNYGVWAANVPAPLKPGARVRMSAAKLRQECMPDLDNSCLSLCFLHGELVGHACATKWLYDEGCAGWITQLVVDARYRRRHVATEMIRMLKRHPWFKDVTIMGIASSHPAACNALCNLFDGKVREIDLAFIKQHAASVLGCSTPRFLKNAPVRGAFLGIPGGSYSADTSFFVDHAEPLEILQTYVAEEKWPFGELLDGHEFLVLLSVPEGSCCVEQA
ncbi:hypothetical protein NUW54_g11736 [Trametes sanguinea]|uniref:Uncharacterized protein n=1 Tax=Trametes sanguinea TaxID=158606 RepID=A0ACC1N9D5_9APHY|nr:hypothetical protein NUW54_g11736 [Trametes sanguinea]